jgi:hypothetical protein
MEILNNGSTSESIAGKNNVNQVEGSIRHPV